MKPSLESALSDAIDLVSELRELVEEIKCQVNDNAGMERDQESEDRSLVEEITRLLGDV